MPREFCEATARAMRDSRLPQTAGHHSGGRLRSSEMRHQDQGKHWVISAEGEWAHGWLDRTSPASRCWEGCWNDASIPDAIEASYRIACPCFAPRSIPRKKTPVAFTSLLLDAAHPAQALYPALSPRSHFLHTPPPCPHYCDAIQRPLAFQTRIASAARLSGFFFQNIQL
jgi:hypothetical protein